MLHSIQVLTWPDGLPFSDSMTSPLSQVKSPVDLFQALPTKHRNSPRSTSGRSVGHAAETTDGMNEGLDRY